MSRVNILFGLLKDKEESRKRIFRFLSCDGVKIVCGGQTAQATAHFMKTTPYVSFEYISDLPPKAEIEGIDLVTEGIYTVTRACEMIKSVKAGKVLADYPPDAAHELAQYILSSDETVIFCGSGEKKAKLCARILEEIHSMGKKCEIIF